jgi:glucose-1-phosphate cytidylyltransferase
VKVVLFCGGLGTRLREHSDTIPKPLVNIGTRPILWHLMRYYAHYGHKDFVLCLGYRGDMIREFFLSYQEGLSNDFVMSEGGKRIDLLTSDIQDWRITFVDTGMHANIGQRLMKVRQFVEKEEMFLANYADGLSDLPLDEHIERFRRSDATATFVGVRSALSFHAVQADDQNYVTRFGSMDDSGFWINGGYFALRPEIFQHMEPGDELVEKPFQRLIAKRKLLVNRYNGFWQSMDTFKDKIGFDRMEARGDCPWMAWKKTKA